MLQNRLVWFFSILLFPLCAACAKDARIGPGPDGKCLENELTLPCVCESGGPGKQCKPVGGTTLSPCLCIASASSDSGTASDGGTDLASAPDARGTDLGSAPDAGTDLGSEVGVLPGTDAALDSASGVDAPPDQAADAPAGVTAETGPDLPLTPSDAAANAGADTTVPPEQDASTDGLEEDGGAAGDANEDVA
jgi:hypothetical protein